MRNQGPDKFPKRMTQVLTTTTTTPAADHHNSSYVSGIESLPMMHFQFSILVRKITFYQAGETEREQ